MMDLSKMKALAAAATPGPWVANKEFANRWRIDVIPAFYDPLAAVYGGVSDSSLKQTDNDATFIAAANPAAVLELIALAERLQSELVAERAAKEQGALTDERAAFEAWMRKDQAASDDTLKRPYEGRYFWPDVSGQWDAWQARAALAVSIQALPVVASAPDFKKIAQAVFDQVTESFISDPDPDTRDYYAGKLAGATEMKAALFKVAPAAAQPEAKEAPAALSVEQIRTVITSMGWNLDPIETEDMEGFAHAVLAAAGNSQDAKDAARWRKARGLLVTNDFPERYLRAQSPDEVERRFDSLGALPAAAMAAAPSQAEGA